MRRAAVSIPSNVAEGAARSSNKEFIHFLYIALGSAAEIETQLIIANNLNYIHKEDFDDLCGELEEINRMMAGLIRYRKGRE